MICAANVSDLGTIAGDMKARKPIRKISAKREKELIGSGFFGLHHNSTIRRKPCNVLPAMRRSMALEEQRSLSALPEEKEYSLNSVQPDAGKILSLIYSQRQKKHFKPARKQSEKQKKRLQRLAAIRLKWWREAEEAGRPIKCGICLQIIRHFEDLASDHIDPGHGKSDDMSNLQPAHKCCNLIKGSQRNFKILPGTHNWRLIHGLL